MIILTLTEGTVGGQASRTGIGGTVGDGGWTLTHRTGGIGTVQGDGLVAQRQFGPPTHTHPSTQARG
jgi:hypothetical protein